MPFRFRIGAWVGMRLPLCCLGPLQVPGYLVARHLTLTLNPTLGTRLLQHLGYLVITPIRCSPPAA